MTLDVCPKCREPLQGLVCRCGLDVREADIIRCEDCGQPTVKSDIEQVKRTTGHPMHRSYRAEICPDCHH